MTGHTRNRRSIPAKARQSMCLSCVTSPLFEMSTTLKEDSSKGTRDLHHVSYTFNALVPNFFGSQRLVGRCQYNRPGWGGLLAIGTLFR